ncbi:DNA-3-methyladenine glycosylase [Lactobacillus sp. YT155]|uniref:DNA-3-methyladenine glycosylase n=1 Tax=Lactobacillus sp. YT155 TaxID=3060955 RepID=UPI00265E9CD3|nr:DNA-3-methyladenine glycosylase [Lactobacillus sp. YT155]MDO1605665.1 DNA-3-methyladenine glycosylase [Lactobacillus sp. YT155]
MNISDFFQKTTTPEIAQNLLGRKLSYQTEKGIVSGLIVEVEAYLGIEDMAAHSYAGRHTKSNDPLYQAGGTIYIYSIHKYLDMDISVQEAGNPQGILIRGLEPIDGLDILQENRPVKNQFDLTNGPAKWMRAFGILDKELSGTMLNAGPLQLSNEIIKQPKNIAVSTRIGIDNKGAWAKKPLRFSVQGNAYVSKTRKSDMDLDSFGWK